MTMKLFSIIFLLIALGISGCKRRQVSSGQQGTTATSTAPPAAEQFAHPEGAATAPLETKYFKGSIGTALGLQMKLIREGDKLTGSYFYQKVGTRIQLTGSVDKESSLVLQEFDPSGKQTGVFKGLWTTSAEDGMVNLVGNWSKPDGQKRVAFSLHEEPIQFGGGVEIVARSIRDTNKKLKYEIDVEYPQLSGLLNPGFDNFNKEASRFAIGQVSEFKKNIAEAADQTETPEQSTAAGSSLDLGYSVALATNDLISIQFDVGSYYHGAAHPNSNSRVLNFDVKKGRSLKLADLFRPGAKYLQALSSYSIKDLKRQSKAKGADGMLDDETIENGAAATAKNYESWTTTKKGLAITFDAYQVGPYAAGPQHVLVPYAVLKDMIDPNGALASFTR